MSDITGELIREVRSASPAPAVVIGADLNFDYIYDCPPLEGGREVLIRSFSREVAGAGGIVACGLARLGAEVRLMTEVGDDADGRDLYEEMGRRGVSRQWIRLRPGGRTPFTLIFAEEADGRPRQVATYPGTGAQATVAPGDLPRALEGARLLYSCSYFLLPRLREDIPELFRLARSRGIVTAYDANGGDGWDDPGQLEHLQQRIHPQTDVIFLNELEAASLTGASDAAEAAASVRPAEATVVIKRGERGAVVRHRGTLHRIDAFPLAGPLRDTVGAGDSFQAAFLFFLLRGASVERCAVLGAANAASTVMHPGGTRGQLDREGLAAFLAGYRIRDEGEAGIRIERREG